MESLGRISRFQTDEAYVYLVRKYIDTGKSDWMNVGDLEKYRDDASRLEPLFLGKKCPDVTFFDPEGKPVSIYETDAPYLLVAFWMYDCSHCKREIPQLIKLYEKYQSKGLKVMSVCGKGGEEEMPKCWEFAKNMKMPEAWLLLADPQRRSQYYTLLNVRSYPRLLLLDKNKMILYKQTGEIPKNALEKIFQNIIENDMK
jgi:thiol-disulfide isomerase/thioredoxin